MYTQIDRENVGGCAILYAMMGHKGMTRNFWSFAIIVK